MPGGRTSLLVDGERFVGSSVRFARALRVAGLTTDLGAAIDFARALALVDLGDREQVRSAGAAVFVRRRDDLEIYDEVFDRFWRRLDRGCPEGPLPGAPGEPGEDEAEEEGASATPTGDDERDDAEAAPDGVPTGGEEDDRGPRRRRR